MQRVSRSPLIYLILFTALTQAAIHPQADISGNCIVDIEDLRLIANQWLNPAGCENNPTDCADIIGANGVNADDFALLARQWSDICQVEVLTDICPKADIDGNCSVDITDLYLLALQWLAPAGCAGHHDDCADIYIPDYDPDGVNLNDLSLLSEQWGQKLPGVLITEFMADNESTLADENGDFSDWIEIHNATTIPVSINGWYLTDDQDELTKWQFPDVTLAPGQYKVIFASDKDRTGGQLHTDFKLSADGEYLALVHSDGFTILNHFSDQYPLQYEDISFGIYDNNPQYFSNPTPGEENDPYSTGQVEDTKFSVDRGFYTNPFSVEITCQTPDATIIYTTDGSEPTLFNGTEYSSAITINSTTCLRTAAFKPGWDSTDIDTQTYIFLDDIAVQTQPTDPAYKSSWSFEEPDEAYDMDQDVVNDPQFAAMFQNAMLSIPTLSIATDADGLFSEETGIYMNTFEDSIDWERCVSAELFDANDTLFQIDCGFKIQGGASRKPYRCPKHSFSLRFRSDYGPSKLQYPLFEDSPVDSFNSLQLRSVYNNSWIHTSSSERNRAQLIRDQWMRDSLLEMGEISAGRGSHVHLYLNGLYWGVYNLHERQDASHYAEYFGYDEDEIDAFNTTSVVDGDRVSFENMTATAASGDWQAVCQVLDVVNYTDYIILNRFARNTDMHPGRNYRTAGGGTAGALWRLYSWDAEHVLEDITNTSELKEGDDPICILEDMKKMVEFRVLFADRLHKHLFNGGALTPAENISRWFKRTDAIELAMIGESARWGDYQTPDDPYTLNDWYLARDWLVNDYFPVRTDLMINRYITDEYYPDVAAPDFAINSNNQFGGNADNGDTLTMTTSDNSATVYYTFDGQDPLVPASATTGTQETPVELVLFSEDAPKAVLVPASDIGTAWYWQVEGFNFSQWTQGSGGVGFETSSGYESYIDIDVEDQMDGFNTSCYIRIPFWVSADDLEIINALELNVRYDDGFIAYLNGVKIAEENPTPDNPPQWNSNASTTHSDAAAVNLQAFDISDKIIALRTGNNLIAIHALNNSLTSSDFLISAQLKAPAESAGLSGFTGTPSPAAIEYLPQSPPALNKSVQVKARTKLDDQWSALSETVFSVGPVAENLRITEIMYHPQDPNAEFVELKNIGTESINLNLVKFTNGIDFTFGNYQLSPSQHVLAVRDTVVFNNTYPGLSTVIAGQYTGSLNNGGERITLKDAAGGLIQSFKYSDNWYNSTDGDGFSLTIKDPSEDLTLWDEKEAWQPSNTIGGSPGN